MIQEKRDLTKSILLAVVILAGGMVIGAGLMFIGLSSQAAGGNSQEPEVFAQRMLGRLGRELNLTVEQQRELDPVFQRHHEVMGSIRAQVRPYIVAELEKLDGEIAAVLTEEQNLLWQEQLRRVEDEFPSFRRGRRRSGGIGGGPHGPNQPLGQGRRREDIACMQNDLENGNCQTDIKQ